MNPEDFAEFLLEIKNVKWKDEVPAEQRQLLILNLLLTAKIDAQNSFIHHLCTKTLNVEEVFPNVSKGEQLYILAEEEILKRARVEAKKSLIAFGQKYFQNF